MTELRLQKWHTFKIKVSDVLKYKGISRKTLLRDIKEGVLENPEDLVQLITYLLTPRRRRDVGQPKPWLEPWQNKKKIEIEKAEEE